MKNKLILVGVGANLPAADDVSSLDSCISALYALARLPNTSLRAVSRWYGSAPLPASDQPFYVNGVVALEGAAEPALLLAQLHEIEAGHGRKRTVPNAARTLDLDLLAVGDDIVATDDLVLPHPRLAERRFVLQPLIDVAPGWFHPGLKQSAEALLALLPHQLLWLNPPFLRQKTQSRFDIEALSSLTAVSN